MKKRMRDERGAVVVEASVVFPVCLIVILMLLYLGNAYYQKARIEAIVVEEALDGAAYCADPLLRAIMHDGGIPSIGETSYEPYRYIGGLFGGMNSIADGISSRISGRIHNLDTGLFAGMKPAGYDAGGLKVQYKSVFVASSVSVDLEYRIELPIRLLGEEDNLSIRFCTHTEVPVGDTPEFIRNVNMVDDILEATGAEEKIENMIKEFKGKLAEMFPKLFKK